MSRQLINEYRAELDRLRQVSGSRRESVLREAFKDLLKRWGKSNDLSFIPEHDIVTAKGNRIYVDGALLHGLRVPFGYWEAKDADDKLDDEIADKFRKGYPKDNIVFSDDVTAVLYQDGNEAGRAAMDDVDALFALVTRFFAHERAEVADFRKAVKQFAADLPAVLEALRAIIAEKRAASSAFARAEADFLKHARDAINPAVSEDDVTEMLIQHVLTEDIFAKVFENPDFHRQNNIAAELYKLEAQLFGSGERAKLLHALRPYYAGIQSTAALISSHSEKQGFLKALYENFYKVYNPKAADKLGVVYTPGEIVRFMIRSADWLCEQHFGKNLIDRGVEILDPATGTGTFIVELLEHFRGDHAKLRHKYKEELHANEVAILPYYVANLNIEATYAAITGQFAEFENLCFVDTLDNVAALGIYSGHQGDMFGGTSDENMGRIKRQNERKISVIIGNPPYNVSQRSENENNKNRAYQQVDNRIRATYVKLSMAQKTAAYDMYVRFYRWAADRLKDDGIVAFVSNRSFLDAQNLDGFRKATEADFSELWVLDLGGDVRSDPSLSGTKHNVFGIQTGVAICFLVKGGQKKPFQVHYVSRPRAEIAEDKLSFLSSSVIDQIRFSTIKPDRRGNWLNQQQSDFDNHLAVAKMPGGRNRSDGYIFELSSTGIMSGRDEWVYDHTEAREAEKLRFFREVFQSVGRNDDPKSLSLAIKWSRNLKRKIGRVLPSELEPVATSAAQFRPFIKRELANARYLIDEMGALNQAFVDENRAITFLSVASSNPVATLAVNRPFDYGLLKSGNGGTQALYRYRYTKSGERVDNITDWAVAQFRGAYGDPPRHGEGDHPQDGGEAQVGARYAAAERLPESAPPPPLRGGPPPRSGEDWKDAIFAYCYAVLHDPVYREKYALNLKREFPRIPFYPDFARWVAWGEALLDLHIGYEAVAPFALVRIDTPNQKRAEGTQPKPKLKSVPDTGGVVVDEDTQLSGIPRAAWDYRLGSRSAIDWVLDQHKEKTPRDQTIAAKFNTYRFADYKESMIDLLARVVTVSVDTMAITGAMAALDRGDWE